MVLTKDCIGNINPRKSFNVFNFTNFYYAAATRADYFIVISYAHKIVYIVFVHYFPILPKHNLCGCFKVFLHKCYPLFSFLFPWNNYSITQDCILVNTFFKKILGNARTLVKFLTNDVKKRRNYSPFSSLFSKCKILYIKRCPTKTYHQITKSIIMIQITFM